MRDETGLPWWPAIAGAVMSAGFFWLWRLLRVGDDALADVGD